MPTNDIYQLQQITQINELKSQLNASIKKYEVISKILSIVFCPDKFNFPFLGLKES